MLHFFPHAPVSRSAFLVDRWNELLRQDIQERFRSRRRPWPRCWVAMETWLIANFSWCLAIFGLAMMGFLVLVFVFVSFFGGREASLWPKDMIRRPLASGITLRWMTSSSQAVKGRLEMSDGFFGREVCVCVFVMFVMVVLFALFLCFVFFVLFFCLFGLVWFCLVLFVCLWW